MIFLFKYLFLFNYDAYQQGVQFYVFWNVYRSTNLLIELRNYADSDNKIVMEDAHKQQCSTIQMAACVFYQPS